MPPHDDPDGRHDRLRRHEHRRICAAVGIFLCGADARIRGRGERVVRRGGRPLVDRFGRYVHLGPEQLARTQTLLARDRWKGIALGRAIPGVRYATVIACGLLKVSYLHYVTAHIAGS